MMKKNNTKKRVKTVTLDLAAEQERYERQADALMRYFKASCPNFITDALIDAIIRAGKKVKFPTPTYLPEESKAARRKMLADLFSQTQMLNRPDERERLALAMSEILNNDLTPERLHRDVGNFYCDISNRLNVDTTERISEALAFGECGFTSCAGTTDGTVCPGPDSPQHGAEASAVAN
jgi:hypothetical protein